MGLLIYCAISLVAGNLSPLDERLPLRPQAANSIGAALAKKFDAEVAISPELGNCPVLFDRKDASLMESLTLLASALNASVVHRGVQLVVERTNADLVRITQQRTSERARWIVNKMADVTAFREQALAHSSLHDAFMNSCSSRADKYSEFFAGNVALPMDDRRPEQLMPCQQLQLDLIKKIGVEKLAELPNNLTIVFENSPKPYPDFYRPIPNINEILESYRGLIAAPSPLDLTGPEQGIVSRSNLFSNLGLGKDRLRVPNLLRLKVNPTSEAIKIELEGFDLEGRLVTEAYLAATPDGLRNSTDQIMAQESAKPDALWWHLTPNEADSILFARGEKVSTVPGWYNEPTKHEPLEAFVVSCMLHLAHPNPDQPLAIVLSDNLFGIIARCYKSGSVNLTAVKRSLASWEPYERLEKDGSVVYRPSDGTLDLGWMDRKLLSAYLHEVKQQDGPSLESYCRFLANSVLRPGGIFGSRDALAIIWANLYPGTIGQQAEFFRLDSKLAVLMGQLSEEDWATLKEGHRITANAFIRTLWTRYLVSDPRMDVPKNLPALMGHAIELFPDGDDTKATISLQRSVARFFINANDYQPGKPGYWAPLETMWQQLSLPRGQSVALSKGGYSVTATRAEFEASLTSRQFILGAKNRTLICINLPFGSKIVSQYDGPFSFSTKVIDFHDLPEKFRENLWQRVCQQAVTTLNSVLEERLKYRTNPGPDPIPPPVVKPS